MADRIVILERIHSGRFRYALRATVPVSRQIFYADVNKTSAWKTAPSADNVELQSGQITEIVEDTALPSGATIAQIQAALQARWTAYQNDVNNDNPWVRYGTRWDGTTWTAGGAA